MINTQMARDLFGCFIWIGAILLTIGSLYMAYYYPFALW